jgi:hypothetical protein
MVYSVTRSPVKGPRNSASVSNCQNCSRQESLLGRPPRMPTPLVGGKLVKLATVFLAPLVALLLFLPAPAYAASVVTLQQADAPPPAPTPEAKPEPKPEAKPETKPGPAPEAAAEPPAEHSLEPTAQPTADPTAEPTEEPTAEPTPEPTPEPDASNPIVDLHATAGRLRGRVEIGWSIAPDQGGGTVFVVERSTNGGSWRPVKACFVPFDGEAKSYGCTDSRLSSGTTYAYRVCLTGKPTSCSNASPSEPVSVKAP